MPLLTTVEIGFTETGEQAFQEVVLRMEEELRSVPGCLEYRLYRRPERVYLFFVVWEDRAAVQRWVENEFHRTVLMRNFRQWCNLGWFGYWDVAEDRNRAQKCLQCGRWTQAQPGWQSDVPQSCRQCGAALG